MRFKTVILIAVAMVFAAAGGAAAQTFPAFPNNSSIFLNSTSAGSFFDLTGTAKRLNVKYVTSTSNGLSRINDRNGTDTGLLFQSTSGNFWQFADTIVFTNTGDRMDIDGFLLPNRNGRSASGSAAFSFTSPAGTLTNGVQLKITGAAVVTIVKNRNGNQAAVKVFNIQPWQVTATTFSNTSAISSVHGDAILSLVPMVKALANHSLPIP